MKKAADYIAAYLIQLLFNYTTPLNRKQASYRETEGEIAARKLLCAHEHLCPLAPQVLEQKLANRPDYLTI